MTFNIHYGTADDGENRWEKRRELVFDIFRDHRPDVVGLQEALRFQLDEIRAALPIYGEIGVGRDDGPTRGEYAAILYRKDRFDVVRSGTFWFSETPAVPGSKSWGAALPRICTWARLKDKRTQRAFHFCNVHLDHLSQESREKSVKQLLAHLREGEDDTPVVITGDFNAGEDNPAIVTLKTESINKRHPSSQESAAGLVDTYRALHPKSTSAGTFHAWSGVTELARSDYILVSPCIDVLAADILHNNRAGRYPSDHFLIMARVRLARLAQFGNRNGPGGGVRADLQSKSSLLFRAWPHVTTHRPRRISQVVSSTHQSLPPGRRKCAPEG